jgi:hypothetical protein
MKIDIDKLTEAELIDLNNRVVERLRFFNQMRATARCSISRSAIVSRFNRKACRS